MKLSNSSPPVTEEIRRELLKLLYAPLLSSLFAASINAIIILFILWDEHSSSTLLLWVTVLLGTFLYRLIDRHRFNQVIDSPFSASQWDNRFIFGVLLSATAWGAAGIFLFPVDSIPHQAFLGFVFAGVSAGALSTLSPSSRAISGVNFLRLVSPPTIKATCGLGRWSNLSCQ